MEGGCPNVNVMPLATRHSYREDTRGRHTAARWYHPPVLTHGGIFHEAGTVTNTDKRHPRGLQLLIQTFLQNVDASFPARAVSINRQIKLMPTLMPFTVNNKSKTIASNPRARHLACENQ